MDNQSSPLPEKIQTELDRQIFHLQTLYDVSRELLGVVEIEAVLKRFLLMTLGNFGVVEGFILTHDTHSKEEPRLVAVGITDKECLPLLEGGIRLLSSECHASTFLSDEMISQGKRQNKQQILNWLQENCDEINDNNRSGIIFVYFI